MKGFRAVIRQPRVVEIEEFAVPDPGPAEVLIRTRASLISPGTERAFFLALPNTNASYPLYPGYSNIGEVISLGAGVATLKVGDRVASGTGHASHVIAPAARCVCVPAVVPDDEAAFFNLIAIAMQGIHKARIELGEPVVVLGAGPIGICAMQMAKASGALPVMIVDQDESRLDLALRAGADVALLNDAQVVDRIREHAGRDGAAVVIEVTGAAAAILSAFQMAGTRGRVILLGSARGDTDQVNFYRDVHRKGLSVIGAHEITRPQHNSLPGWWTQRDEQQIALKLLAKGRMTVKPLISHRFAWRALAQAYALLESWDPAATGMVINWLGEQSST
jgi:2-desacetyl-2-hydroxyethyl bacteriochlorophyllide A dehydrogenase